MVFEMTSTGRGHKTNVFRVRSDAFVFSLTTATPLLIEIHSRVAGKLVIDLLAKKEGGNSFQFYVKQE